ncbi:uncharacterized protein LOC143233136 isoform X3 [Tachypleus tridentatus]|uniref:uncharacterized protein LOC143233136 isoform X3 n=1 Tax=Tachypleus tridentatus TaxID=6853 RepID=UPI003FD09249
MALQKKTSLWGCHFCPTILLVCLFLHVTFPVKIKRLSVPRWVRNGTDHVILDSPAKNFSVSHSKVATSETDIFCEATGLYPRPEISLSVVLPDIQKHTVLQGTKKQVNLTNGSYSILLARRFSERDLAKANVLILECKVYIPGTNYKITKEISFYAGLSDVNRGTSRNFSLRCFLLFFAALTLTS